MKKIINLNVITFFIILLILQPCYGQSGIKEGQVPQPYPKGKKYAPTPLPDRIILSRTEDPSVSQAVTWRTDTSVPYAVAQIDIADANGYNLHGDTLPAQTVVFESDQGNSHYHSVRFTGLLPDMLYAYRVGDGVNWSEWFHFKTASQSSKPFSFIYFGDAQDDIHSLCSRIFQEAYRKVPDAAFTLHAGDLINRAYRDVEWGEWFEALSWINPTVPAIAAIGNHEYMRTPEGDRQIDPHWFAQFAFPRNGPEGLENTCYYIDYQGARIIVLNSYEQYEEQARWLQEVLGNNPQYWTIVVSHYPVYSPRERNYKALQDFWRPLFDEYAVDLVLTGHDHTYARMNDPAHVGQLSSKPQRNYTGPVYVVSTSGPKLREIVRNPWITRAGDHIQLYQKITVDPWQIRYESYMVTGELYDAFTLKKREGQPNELIEVFPEECISTPTNNL